MEFVVDADFEPLENIVSEILQEDINVDAVRLPSGARTLNLRSKHGLCGVLTLADGRIRLDASGVVTQKLRKHGPTIRAAIDESYIRWV